MTYFLERIASLLYEQYHDRMNSHCLVFPNRRAGLYFLKYLSVKAGKPIWAPATRTINELFTFNSPLKVAESETLIFELYRVYKNLNKKAESFDEFYFWGELLLNDFDDVDKYMVDASKLFANISDLKKIDSEFGKLTPEQINTIRQFWVNFNPEAPTDQKTDFLNLWEILQQLYTGFRNALIAKGFAYEGMIYRDLALASRKGKLSLNDFECYHFIGFNALNTSEQYLMQALQKAGKAKFYWDYDNSFINEKNVHSAGYFIRNNLKIFGNDMPADWDYNTLNPQNPKNAGFKVVDTSSDIAQVKLVSGLLHDMPGIKTEESHHTAVVLADENLLVPLLSSIPEDVDRVNVTMGYPLRFSPVYSLLNSLLNMQKNIKVSGTEFLFEFKDVLKLLKHNYFADHTAIEDILKEVTDEKIQWISSSRFRDIKPFNEIFLKAETPSSLTSYLKNILEGLFIASIDEDYIKRYSKTEINIRNEFIYRTLLALNRLESTMAGSEILLSVSTYSRLIDKVLRSLSIPFSGEPLNGIQIMGILETRTLDFKNLIILSVNEGVLPRSSAGSSYIPYNLREAFGLPTLRHQDSIYSYYFYRLLQRSENVIFIFNSNAEGLRTGEMSRFLTQLKFLSGFPPEFVSHGYEIGLGRRISEKLNRSEDHQRILEDLFLGEGKKLLSPSAVNTWLSCRMKFYYRYVCGLKEPEKIVTEMDHALFGNLLHGIIERVYSPMKGNVLSKTNLEELIKGTNELRKIIEEAIILKCHNGIAGELYGNDLIIGTILEIYLKMIIRMDLSLVPLTIKELEKWVTTILEPEISNQKVKINVGGRVDRIDFIGGKYRIVDYKTGSVNMEIDSVESLFDESDEDRNESWFQILMYCELLTRENPSYSVAPAIYALRKMQESGFSGNLIVGKDKNTSTVIEDYSAIREEYSRGLVSVIEKIFSRNEPFTMTENNRKCDYCAFRQLCQR